MMYVVLYTLILGYLIYRLLGFRKTYLHYRDVEDKFTPIGPTHPILGNTLQLSTTEEYFDLVLSLVERTKTKLYVVWLLFLYPTFISCHPETARIILKTSEPKTRYHAGGIHRMLLSWLGDGLLTSDGSKWMRNRRLLTPAFHFEILKPYISEYNQVAHIFLNNLKRDMDRDKYVEVYHLVSLATLDTMLRCTLSYEDNVQEKGSDHPYVNAVKQLSNLFAARVFKPWLYFDFVYNLTSNGRECKKLCDFVHDFADKIITKRRDTLKEDSSLLHKRRLDFLDILITAKDESDAGLTDKEIRQEVDTFLFEGHDTTASAISWAIYSLGKYPDEQEKVYREVNQILGKKEMVEWDDLPKFKRLSVFLKEVLRMFSPVSYVSRWLTKPLEFDGVVIPKHSVVDVNIHAINHHPDVWPDHKEFKPERFEDESFLERDAYSYVPFSAGPRNCIGQNFAMNEQRVILARLIQRFKVRLVPGHEYKLLPELVMRSKYGIKVELEERMFKVRLVPGHEYKLLPELVMRSKYGIKVELEERM